MYRSPLIEELNSIPSPGLGCASFGGTHWGLQDDRESMAALARAIDAGVRHIDTAAAYGAGRSETLIGNFIRRRPSIRDRLLIASKGGIKGSKKNFLKEIDNSRRRLGCEVIDIYYIHWPMAGVDPGYSLEALAEARDKHSIRYAGVSNFSPRQVITAYGQLSLDACQFGYNLIWRNPDTELIPLCENLGIARIAYGALAQGLLTGNYQPWRRFPEGDDRSSTVFFSGEYTAELAKGLSALKALSAEYHVPLRSAALHWISSREYIEGALAGARNAAQAGENFQLQKIDSELMDKIHVAGKEISACFGNTENFFSLR